MDVAVWPGAAGPAQGWGLGQPDAWVQNALQQSPNFDETMKVAEMSKCPVIISGGVSSIDDIKKAKKLENVEGIIVGKAIYDGDIKLEELVKENA